MSNNSLPIVPATGRNWLFAFLPLSVVLAVSMANASQPVKATNELPTALPAKANGDTRFAHIRPAGSEWIDVIRDGMKKGTEVLGPAYIVKAASFKDVYFVAAKVTRAGIPEGVWGIWAIGSDNTMILCADEMSKSSSIYLRGDNTMSGVWAPHDPEGINLRLYVAGRQ